MVVYAEYLFLENFITGIIILYFSGRICGRKTKKIRLCAGGALCGLFSFILFVNIRPAVLSFLVKFAFSLLAVCITFSPRVYAEQSKRLCNGRNLSSPREHGIVHLKSDLRECGAGYINENILYRARSRLRLVLAFYIVSFLMGGLTLAVIYITGIKGVSGNGYVYMDAPSYVSVTAGIIASTALINIFVKCIGSVIKKQRLKCRARLELQGKEFELNAYTDTGNGLRDPVSGAPVSVISKSKAEEIIKEMTEEEAAERYCVIPFRAAGTKYGVMQGFRADCLVADTGEEERRLKPAVIAVYEGEFAESSAEERFDILLNKEILGGELI